MAAQPILASTLWTAHKHSDATIEASAKRVKLATTCSSLNSALDGGIDYGSMTCLSAEADCGQKEISHSLLATHLLDASSVQAIVLDTTNSFDVRKLHKQILSTLLETLTRDEAQRKALKVLDRVRIMKAFDFVGLTECVAELRDSLEERPSQHPTPEPQEQNRPRATVGDSEDEDEDEMLDEPSQSDEPQTCDPPAEDNTMLESSQRLLIIDDLTQVVAPLLKNNHVQGQALLASFMRSLGHLTREYHLCTVIFNAAVAYNNNSARDTPSIFSSCAMQPALGKSFTYLVDVYLLLHKVPLTAKDAQTLYSTQAATGILRRTSASVLEVLQDRNSDRVGRWAPFQIDAEGKLKSVS